jgi:hypothetical protein
LWTTLLVIKEKLKHRIKLHTLFLRLLSGLAQSLQLPLTGYCLLQECQGSRQSTHVSNGCIDGLALRIFDFSVIPSLRGVGGNIIGHESDGAVEIAGSSCNGEGTGRRRGIEVSMVRELALAAEYVDVGSLE